MTTQNKTARYAQKLATLSSRPIYVKEAALLKAIVNGRQWEMDAVIEAIDTNPVDWNDINRLDLFKHAGMFGRLELIQDLSKKFKFKKDEYTCAWEIIEAFDVAVIHGHYDVADFCLTLGLNAGYMKHNDRAQRAMYSAIEEADLKKIDYLVKAGASPDYHLLFAVTQNNKDVIDHLIDKNGANINYVSQGVFTPLETAVKYGYEDIAMHLLEKGADPTKANSELMHTIADRNHINIMMAVLERGAKPTARNLEDAVHNGHLEMAQVIVDSGVSIHGTYNQPLLLATISSKPEAAIAFCLKNGASAKAAWDSLQNNPETNRFYSRDKMAEQLKKLLGSKTVPQPKV